MSCRAAICFIALLAALSAVFTARAGDLRGRSIEVSSPSEAGDTNAMGGLQKQLQEDLLQQRMQERILRPFQSGGDSLDAATALPYIPQEPALSAADVRKLKAKIAERRSWMYGDAAGPSQTFNERNQDKDNPLSGPEAANNSNERDALSMLKKQYSDLAAKGQSISNAASGSSFSDDENPDRDSSSYSNGDRRRKKDKSDDVSTQRRDQDPNQMSQRTALEKQRQDAEDAGTAMPKSIFSEIFGSSSQDNMPMKPSPRDEQRASDFQKLLDGGGVSDVPKASLMNPLGVVKQDDTTADNNALGDSHAMATMATMPGYNPVSSLTPALAIPDAMATPSPAALIQPAPPMKFNQSYGPPKRQF